MMEPMMRTDEHHVERHARILAMMKERYIGTVFLGDSLTRRWEDNEALWVRYFSRFAPANFGVGGDCIEHVKWRILNGELDGIQPRVLVLLAGTNNLATNTAAEVILGIQELAGIIREKLPSTKIFLLGLFPRSPDENGAVFSGKISEINQALSRYCEREGVRFADFGSALLGADGSVDRSIMEDGLHLNAKGYEIIGPLLSSALEEIYQA